MLEFSIYVPRRRSSSNRRSCVALGIGNMIGPNEYIPLVDIDRKLDDIAIEYIVRTGWNVIGRSSSRCGYIVTDTMKGHHVIWIDRVDWKTLNRLWTRLKPYLDRKWITVQRRRGYAVIRVRGKYPVRDLRVRKVYLNGGEEMDKVYRWVKLYLLLVGYL